jgi:hypothetical protein
MGHLAPYQVTALEIGFAIGFLTEVLRKVFKRWGAYGRFVGSGAIGFAVGWIVDAIVLSSPYASSTGGFLEISTAAWFAAGSVLAAFFSPRRPPVTAPEEKGDALPEDMSSASLLGGGLIAGESLYTLGAAIAALLALM